MTTEREYYLAGFKAGETAHTKESAFEVASKASMQSLSGLYWLGYWDSLCGNRSLLGLNSPKFNIEKESSLCNSHQ